MHSFYAGMGGFVFDMDSPDMKDGPSFMPKLGRLHVTPRGIQLLANCGLLPQISKKAIADKNKTDGAGKLFCCIQVGWMLFQTVTRLAVGLPISPLEVNTIGHVFCALLNFLLWWSKPRWIREPTVLHGEWTRPLCAFMYMCSQVSEEEKRDRDILRDFGVKSEISRVLYVPTSSRRSPGKEHRPMPPESTVELQNQLQNETLDVISSSAAAKTWRSDMPSEKGSIIPRTVLRRGTFSHEIPEPRMAPDTSDDTTTTMRQIRWSLACEAIGRYDCIRDRLEHVEYDEDEIRYHEALRLYPEMPQKIRQKFKRGCLPNEPSNGPYSEALTCVAEELVIDQPRNWPGDDLVRHMQGHLMGVILWTASMAYGAVHVAAWYEQFPTEIESWFWRMSAVYIIFSGVLWSLLNLMGHFSGSVWWYWYDILAGNERRVSHIVIYILCCIGGTLYIIARVYLVAEAFLSLRALPESAYQSPSWVLAIPHL